MLSALGTRNIRSGSNYHSVDDHHCHLHVDGQAADQAGTASTEAVENVLIRLKSGGQACIVLISFVTACVLVFVPQFEFSALILQANTVFDKSVD
eukprot:6187324-Pleurochrysis_carterae.AAC.1